MEEGEGGDLGLSVLSALLELGIEPIALGALEADVGGIETKQFPEGLSGGVAERDGVVAALGTAAVEGIAGGGEGVMAGDVVVELVMIAPGEEPGAAE